MRNEKVTSEELCKALRCSATPIPKGRDCLKHCKVCAYDYTEKPGKFEILLAEKDGLVHGCDVDKMSMDAAERIEELEKNSEHACELIYSLGVERSKLEKRVQALVHEIQFTPLVSALCRYCKHEERESGEAPCENCEGLDFEWEE